LGGGRAEDGTGRAQNRELVRRQADGLASGVGGGGLVGEEAGSVGGDKGKEGVRGSGDAGNPDVVLGIELEMIDLVGSGSA